MRLSSVIALFVLIAPSGLASDWYVDAVNGSDSLSGTSALEAWRTLTHALSSVPAPASGQTQVVHVAPGQYDAALGESFPLILRDAFQIVGDAGLQATILDAGGAASVLRAWHSHFNPEYIGPSTLVRGLTLRNAVNGVDLRSGTIPIYLTLQESRITGMSAEGVYALSQCGWGCGSVVLALEHVEISFCDVGLHSLNTASSNQTSTSLVDCIVHDNATLGIHQEMSGNGTTLACLRTRIRSNGSDGFLLDPHASLSASHSSFEDCLIAQNAGAGVHVLAAGTPSPWLFVDVSRCTIADNAASGIDAFDAWPGSTTMTLQGSILFGNQDDVRENPAQPSVVLAQYCDIGDGDFAGGLGNLALDPLFRAPAALDYRPRWGSPCADAGDPATSASLNDLAGMPRGIDGDLDTFGRADIGAFESTPLVSTGVPHLGAIMNFEQWGPAGGRAALRVSRGPRAEPPLATGLGDVYIDPAAFRELGTRPVAPGPPALRPFPIPNDPLWIGKVLTFQMLATSSTGTPPAAWSNPVTLVILP